MTSLAISFHAFFVQSFLEYSRIVWLYSSGCFSTSPTNFTLNTSMVHDSSVTLDFSCSQQVGQFEGRSRRNPIDYCSIVRWLIGGPTLTYIGSREEAELLRLQDPLSSSTKRPVCRGPKRFAHFHALNFQFCYTKGNQCSICLLYTSRCV